MPSTSAERSPEFRIFETDEFGKSIDRLGSSQFLRTKLRNYVYPQLRQAPWYGPNVRKLRGYEPETWRYRIGPYRIFYCVDSKEKIVFMLTVNNRKDAYK
jgi:mRNA interferase RelE/StbE